MSGKVRGRSRSNSNKNQASISSRSSSPSYDYPSVQSAASAPELKANTDVSYESRITNLELSITSIQSSLNQLVALQLQAAKTTSPKLEVNPVVAEVKSSPSLSPTKVLPNVDPIDPTKVSQNVDPIGSTLASSKPNEIQQLLSGLSQLFSALRINSLDPNSLSSNAPSTAAATSGVANVDPSTVIPPMDNMLSRLSSSPTGMKISAATFTNCNNVISGASGNTPEFKSMPLPLTSNLEAKVTLPTNVDNINDSRIVLSNQSSPQLGSRSSTTQLYNMATAPSQWSKPPVIPAAPIASKPKLAAIEQKLELPSKSPRLPGNGSPKPEEFMQWLSQIVDYIDAIPKLRPILLEPTKGWDEFKRINSKFSPADLESDYLNCHRSVWAYISSGLEDQTRMFLKSELETYSRTYNLPEELGFNLQDDDFYKNCYELKCRLVEKYGTTSRFRAVEIHNELTALKMKANEDPQVFFDKWRMLQLQLRATSTNFNMPSEEQQVTTIITKLPRELENSLKPLIITGKANTVKEVESIMRNWYQSNRATGSTSGATGSTPGATGFNKSGPTFNKSGSSAKPKSGASTPAAAAAYGNNPKFKDKKHFNKNRHRDQQAEGQPGNLQSIDDILAGSTIVSNVVTSSTFTENLQVSDSESDSDLDLDDILSGSTIVRNVDTNSTAIANPVTSSNNIFQYDVIIDSGSSENLTGYKDKLQDSKETKPLSLATANGIGKPTSSQVGRVPLTPKYSITDVRYVQNCPFTLASVGKLCNKGLQVVFTQHGGALLKPRTVLLKQEDVLIRFTKKDNIYVIEDALKSREDIEAETRKSSSSLVRRGSTSTDGESTSTTRNYSSQQARTDLDKAREARRVSFKPPDPPKTPKVDAATPATPTPAATAILSNLYSALDSGVDSDNVDSDNSDEDLLEETFAVACPAAPTNTECIEDEIAEAPDPLSNLTSKINKGKLWHSRLGHAGLRALQLTNDFYNLQLSTTDLKRLEECRCDICLQCKTTRTPISRSRNTIDRLRVAESTMDCWHVDLVGPFSTVENGRRIRTASLDGNCYALVIVDEYSRFVMVNPIKRKSDATSALISTIKLFQTTTSRMLKRLHSDGGGEFLNRILQKFLSEQGTEVTTTTPNTPALNGIVERINRILAIMARCMLIHADAPVELWCLAYSYATQIYNMLCHPSIQSEVPSCRMYGTRMMNVDHFKVFGCDAYALIEEGKRGKLQSTASPGIFVGWSDQYNGYKILSPTTLEITISRNVQFNESSFKNLQLIKSTIMETAQSRMAPEDDEEYEVESITDQRKRNGELQYQVYWKGYRVPTWEPISNLDNCRDILQKFLNSRSNKTKNVAAATAVALASTTDLGYKIPQSYNEASTHPDSTLWNVAIKSELDSLSQQCVFTPATPPKGRKAIGCRWVFDVKRDSNNIIIRHKARLVVQGFRQKEGVDYFETFSPTVRIKSIKYLLALAAQEDLEIKQLDFDTAFLNAVLKEDIYVVIPQGYVDNLHGHTALKLNRALYGLKQASREWWLDIDAFLNSLGYKSSGLDECLYVKIIDGKRIYITLYVDDTLAIYPKSLEHIWLEDKAKLATKYAIKDIGECTWILHMELKRDRPNRTITLTQKAYIEKVLDEHGITESTNSCVDPFFTADITVPPDKIQAKPLSKEEHETYRSIVGSLLYAANITRVDIAYIVGLLARYCAAPMNYHLMAAKRVLRYLRGTTNYQLIFRGSTQSINSHYNLVLYTDSSWGDNKDDRKGTGGHLSTINDCPIAWQSKKHSTTPLSSTEAEYYALSAAVREALFLRQWFKIYRGQLLQIEIRCDNQGAIHMSDHTTNHNRTKHIDIQHYFIREHIRQNKINIIYTRSADQLADILTKAMKPPNFKRLSKLLMNTPSESS
jgi:hypothetical protein